VRPFRPALEGAGRFPGRGRPRVRSRAITEGRASLRRLGAAVPAALRACGAPAPDRPPPPPLPPPPVPAAPVRTVAGAVAAPVAVITGWWPILGVVGAQLAIGLAFGRRYCVPCLLYCEVIQPRIGEGPIEDSRPPRFANLVGAIFLLGATAAYLAGFDGVGLVLGTIVAALALLAASTGLCVGCEM